MWRKPVPLLLVGLLTGCVAAGGSEPAPSASGGGPGAVHGSFLEDAPSAWLGAMDVWHQMSTASTCQELDALVKQVPVPPASAPDARHNATVTPLYFATASARERALGC